MLGLFTSEIFFEEINFVVLQDAFDGALGHALGCLGESESGLSVHLLLILGNLCWLGGVVFDWPSTFFMLHSLGTGWDSFGVHL